MKTKLLLPLILVAIFLLGACTPQSCPTYSRANFIAPIEEQRPLTKWDTMPATYADVIAYMNADTIPKRFSLVEKAGAVVGIYLIISAINSQRE